MHGPPLPQAGCSESPKDPFGQMGATLQVHLRPKLPPFRTTCCPSIQPRVGLCRFSWRFCLEGHRNELVTWEYWCPGVFVDLCSCMSAFSPECVAEAFAKCVASASVRESPLCVKSPTFAGDSCHAVGLGSDCATWIAMCFFFFFFFLHCAFARIVAAVRLRVISLRRHSVLDGYVFMSLCHCDLR